MAKKALINREAKRVALAKKYAAKRAAIFAVINDANATPLLVAHVVYSANLVWVVLKSVRSLCVAIFRVLLKPLGNRSIKNEYA